MATSSLAEALVDIAASAVLVAGVTDKHIRIYKMFLVFDAATDVTFLDGTTELNGAISVTPGSSIVFDFDSYPWFTTSAGNDFKINLSSPVQVSGRVYYKQA